MRRNAAIKGYSLTTAVSRSNSRSNSRSMTRPVSSIPVASSKPILHAQDQSAEVVKAEIVFKVKTGIDEANRPLPKEKESL